MHNTKTLIRAHVCARSSTFNRGVNFLCIRICVIHEEITLKCSFEHLILFPPTHTG